MGGCIRPLCGYNITPFGPGGPDAWVARIRAVYSESGSVSLSGIGLCHDGRCTLRVPRSPSKTYEDLRSGEVPALDIESEDYGPDPRGGIPIGPGFKNPDGTPKVYKPTGMWGFVFHDACWKLLDALYGKDDVPLRRLHATLRSLPSPLGVGGPSWSHTYGGLHRRFHESEKPWGHTLHVSQRGDSDQGSAAPYNPFRIPYIARLHEQCLANDPDKCRSKTTKGAAPGTSKKRRSKDPYLQFTWSHPEKCGRDPSARLPPEVIRMVADILPVRDVGAARGAFRTFVPVFLDQHFWRTRFEARGERAWLFEALRGNGGEKELDWRYLYRRKHKRYVSLSEQNRARIWPILEEVRDVLSLEWCGPAPSPPGVVDGDAPHRHWLTVGADIDDTPASDFLNSKFSDHCYRFRKQAIHLPGAIKAISASVVRLEELMYVTGMSVTPVGQGRTWAGYRNPRGKESVEVAGRRAAM